MSLSPPQKNVQTPRDYRKTNVVATIEIPTPSLGLLLPLSPILIFTPQKLEALQSSSCSMAGEEGRVTEDHGRDHPPGPVCQGVEQKGVRAENHCRGWPSLSPLSPQFSASGVQCVTRRKLGVPSPPRNQCCPVGLVQCVPSICPRPSPGESWKKSGRIPTTGPAGWVALGRWKEEPEGSAYPVTEASAPRAGPAHLQRRCLSGMG